MSSSFSMLDLLRTEVETQSGLFGNTLREFEQGSVGDSAFDALTKAAHSIAGAGRLVSVHAISQLGQALEELAVAVQNHTLVLDSHLIGNILSTLDTITQLCRLPDEALMSWHIEHADELTALLAQLQQGHNAEQLRPTEIIGFAPAIDPSTPVDLPALDLTMIDLFRAEVESHGSAICDGLLALEAQPMTTECIDALMRAAHSIKGAARLVGVQPVVTLAHVMEDVFVAAQKHLVTLLPGHVDILLAANDLMLVIARFDNTHIAKLDSDQQAQVLRQVRLLESILIANESCPDAQVAQTSQSAARLNLSDKRVDKKIGQDENFNATIKQQAGKDASGDFVAEQDRVLRITADRWDRMMGLTSEMKVEAGWLHPYVDGLTQLKKRQFELQQVIESLRDYGDVFTDSERFKEQVAHAHRKSMECRQLLSDKLADLDMYERRLSNLSARLHRETITTRMRPFADGVHGFQRMIRDIARSLGKKIKLDINGLSTQVDRDVLERMEAPLNHIMRNAVDHGVEFPQERIAAGKPESASITLTACHSEGMLSIMVEDDGRGIDVERLRSKVIEKGLVVEAMAANLSEEELLEFLFLPSFSTRDEVTDISGRGVGLDVVLDTIQKMRGSVKVTTQYGKGSRFHMQLPLTLSVVSALIVSIADEMYAFPLARIVRAVKIPVSDIQVLEDHQYAIIDGENVGLVGATEVFEMGEQCIHDDTLPIVVISDKHYTYGVVVDRFIGQRELALQTLDRRLGKIHDISAAALLEDGTPVLIVDVDDMVCTIDNLVRGGRIGKVSREAEHATGTRRVLVVDDSLTVREVERSLLEAAGYEVDQAVDGKDGWNAIRTGNYELVITDIDMPRMDGIELVRLIKSDQRFSGLPVIIVSYKDRAEDRIRGMEAGADYYLAKGSFHDDTLLHAVHDLIGSAGE